MSEIKLTADSGGGTTSLKAPSTTTSNADVVLKLPVADGSSGQVLKTDGSGQLSFTSNAGTTINANADNRVITGSGTANTLNGESNLTYDGSTLKVNAGLLEVAHTSCHIDFMETSTTNHRLRNGSGNFHIQRISDDKNTTTTQFLVDGGTGSVELYHNGTKKLSTQSGGICFNSDNTDANALDDYEEGTWTPVFQNVNTPTYTTQYGRYCKIGSIVHIVGQISIGSIDTSDGSTVNIGGLPFVGNSAAETCLFTFGRYTNLLPEAKLDDFTNVRFGGNYIMLHEGNNADISYAELNSSGTIQFSASYIINT